MKSDMKQIFRFVLLCCSFLFTWKYVSGFWIRCMNPSIPLLNDTLKHFRKLFRRLTQWARARTFLMRSYSLTEFTYFSFRHTSIPLFFLSVFSLFSLPKLWPLNSKTAVSPTMLFEILLGYAALLLLLLFRVIFHLNGIFSVFVVVFISFCWCVVFVLPLLW